METYIALISAATAVIAVTIGPLVQLYIAKLQVNASTVATFRQAWIDSLRDEIAIYLGEWAKVATRWQRRGSESEGERYDKVKALTRHEAKIRLLINPNEPDHCELVELVEAATALADEEFAGVTSSEVVDRLAGAQNKIVAKAQSVLKREWERVKKQN